MCYDIDLAKIQYCIRFNGPDVAASYRTLSNALWHRTLGTVLCFDFHPRTVQEAVVTHESLVMPEIRYRIQHVDMGKFPDRLEAIFYDYVEHELSPLMFGHLTRHLDPAVRRDSDLVCIARIQDHLNRICRNEVGKVCQNERQISEYLSGANLGLSPGDAYLDELFQYFIYMSDSWKNR